MSRESLSALLRSSPCFLIQIFYGGQKGKLHGKLSVANEDLSHDTRKWSGRMNSEGESCHSGKLHLPFATGTAKTIGTPQPKCSGGFMGSTGNLHSWIVSSTPRASNVA